MERLIKVGNVSPKMSKDIKKSRIGLGFEKLDRDVFDPEKAYPFVAQSGVKWCEVGAPAVRLAAHREGKGRV